MVNEMYCYREGAKHMIQNTNKHKDTNYNRTM